LKLTQKLRKNTELASTYLLEPPNSKKIEFKTFPPLFLIYCIFGQHLPEKTLFCREEEEGSAHIFMAVFRGGWPHDLPLEIIFQGRVAASAAPENGAHFRG